MDELLNWLHVVSTSSTEGAKAMCISELRARTEKAKKLGLPEIQEAAKSLVDDFWLQAERSQCHHVLLTYRPAEPAEKCRWQFRLAAKA